MPRCVLASTECDGCMECFRNDEHYNDFFEDKEHEDETRNSHLQDM